MTGRYRYDYSLINDGRSEEKLLYVALYPLEPAVINGVAGVVTGLVAAGAWAGFAGCNDHIDVGGWMSRRPDSIGPPEGLRPGRTLGGFSYWSVNPPIRGHWIAGGGKGCGTPCFPWADSCSLASPLHGLTVVAGNGVYPRASISGEVVTTVGLNAVSGARIAVLGAGRDTTSSLNGSYFLPGLPVGRFRVRATAPGYAPDEAWVEFFPGNSYLNFRLRTGK